MDHSLNSDQFEPLMQVAEMVPERWIRAQSLRAAVAFNRTRDGKDLDEENVIVTAQRFQRFIMEGE